ncbi:MAG: hypothetical protein WBJ09_03285 [Candidatus Cloacimonas acidaminovorans]|jgi:hypothetical protein
MNICSYIDKPASLSRKIFAGKMGWQLPICQGVRSTQKNKCLLFMENHNSAAKMLNLILFSPRLKPIVNFCRSFVLSAQVEIQKKKTM